MSNPFILAVGFAIFFLTVYGIVVLSGVSLMKKRISEQPEFRDSVDDDEIEKTLPTKMKY